MPRRAPPRPPDRGALAVALAASAVAQGLGAWMTSRAVTTWYPSLIKPTWTPPDWVFAPVWTALYVLMAVAAWLVWRERARVPVGTALTLYGTQLALNVAWSGLFFGWRDPGAGLVGMIVLEDTVRQMAGDGVRRALAFVTSGFSSYSACRQYRENIERAIAAVGPAAPRIDKLRLYYNHPGFIDAVVDHTRTALTVLPASRRAAAHLAFTAHSIPRSMAETSDYEAQLLDAAALVVQRLGDDHPWRLVYQSRSGPPTVPWLEPDIGDHLETLSRASVTDVVAVPIGFVSDHMEVRYDLDTEAAARARALGLRLLRAATPGNHPAFVHMIRQLILERTAGAPPQARGRRGPASDLCPPGCCQAPPQPNTTRTATARRVNDVR